MKWVYLTTTSDQISAELLVQALRGEGIEALVNAGDTSGFMGVSASPCRVMVNEDQLATATALLEEWDVLEMEDDRRE